MFRVLFLLLLLSGCASRSTLPQQAIESYRCGNAFPSIDEDNFPIQGFLQNKEAVWQLLDRATLRLAKGDAEKSIDDFQIALDAIDYYRGSILSEHAAQLLIDDKEAAYIAPIYESLLARLIAACACFQAGDLSNAAALLRQAEEIEGLERELGNISKDRINPIATYLLAAALEREGDISQARILYEQLGAKDDLERISTRDKTHATLLCLVHEGLLPEKESITAPASIISMELLELMLKAWDIEPAISSISGIAIPAFPENVPYTGTAFLQVDGEPIPCTVTHDILETAKADLKSNITTIATRAAARQLIRRAGVGYAYHKDSTIGMMADIGMLIANLATSADIRMWHTLPRELRLLRIELTPGTHTIRTASGQTHTIQVKAGDLCLVQLFRPHGRENQLLIPTTR